MEEINIYCDESCHLEHDNSNVMVIGGVWLPKDKRIDICKRIKEIKIANNISLDYELKWSKVSRLKSRAYIDLINLFFDNEDLHFRGVVVKDKDKLDFDFYDGNYEIWYYKIYYTMISTLLSSDKKFNIYMDIKDNNQSKKIKTLKACISAKSNHLTNTIINNVQTVRSEEIEIMQLTDVLIGALSYYHRNLNSSETKSRLLQLISNKREVRSMEYTSLLRDDKFNILIWRPKNHEQ